MKEDAYSAADWDRVTKYSNAIIDTLDECDLSSDLCFSILLQAFCKIAINLDYEPAELRQMITGIVSEIGE